MTELKASGRSATPLLSETNITDGNWHRIGFVWDGSSRVLYVDGIAVAEDTQTNLEGSYSGLYIGTGNFMEPGTYFSGLIDDVRIYNRASTRSPNGFTFIACPPVVSMEVLFLDGFPWP